MSGTQVLFLRQLGQGDADALVARVRRRSIAKSEPILHAGAAGDDVVLVISGRVRLVAYGGDQPEGVLALPGPRELLGGMAALAAPRPTGSAVPVADVEAGVPAGDEVPA